MTTRYIAEYARSLDMIERWAELSLTESRLRRRKARSPWTVPVLVGVAVVMYLMIVYAMGGR